MNILITVETLVTGGAEVFSMRLSEALAQGDKVILYRFYEDYINPELTARLAPGVKLAFFHSPVDQILRKADSVLKKFKLDFSVRNYFIRRHLRNIIQENQIDIIHSNQFKVDYEVAKVATSLGIPVLVTIHGDYLKFWHQQPSPILNYKPKVFASLSRISQVACISDVQLAFFKTNILPRLSQTRELLKIYNGYSLDGIPEDGQKIRKRLGIGEGDFVFGMVSRGIPEKGWETLIQAFLAINDPKTHLVLVGESPYLTKLKERNKGLTNIHFVGFSANPVEYIYIFDVGLLPSVYGSESLPTVVIEYLFCGKPVVGSDVGEIRNMITEPEHGLAGMMLSVEQGKVDWLKLKECMERYLHDPVLLRNHGRIALLAAEKFHIATCRKAYRSAYENLIRENNLAVERFIKK